LDLAIRSVKSLYFFDLSLDLDRTSAQQKAKSKVKVTYLNNTVGDELSTGLSQADKWNDAI